MKKVLTSVIVVVMLLSIVCCCVACNTKEPLDQVIDCAKALRDKVNDESFEIAGDCGYQDGYEDDDGDYYFNKYIAIQFKVTDKSGEEVYDIAYYVNGSFVGYDSNWDDKSYENFPDSRKLKYLQSLLIEFDGYYTKVFTKETINSALGIGVSSGEAGSGAEDAEA